MRFSQVPIHLDLPLNLALEPSIDNLLPYSDVQIPFQNQGWGVRKIGGIANYWRVSARGYIAWSSMARKPTPVVNTNEQQR